MTYSASYMEICSHPRYIRIITILKRVVYIKVYILVVIIDQ